MRKEIQPKDLLVHLEKGDRSMEHLAKREEGLPPQDSMLDRLQALQMAGQGARQLISGGILNPSYFGSMAATVQTTDFPWQMAHWADNSSL